MIGTKVVGLGLCAMLAACDAPAADKSADEPSPALTIRNDFHERLILLDPLPQGAALRRVIRSSGESCDRVESAAFQQDYTNLKMWTARCQNSAYAVFLAPSGDVQVRKCADTVSLKLPACRLAAATG